MSFVTDTLSHTGVMRVCDAVQAVCTCLL